MNHESEYQYNSCSSRGICSINPTTASFLEIILLYLKNAAFYGLQLEKQGKKDKKIYNLILNTISIINSNSEISEQNFEIINAAFQNELPRIIQEYKNLCKEKNIQFEELKSCQIPDKKTTINEYIRLGEKEFNKRIQTTSNENIILYRILFVLIKSICTNILTYESYNFNADTEIIFVLKILNHLNSPDNTKEFLKELISELAQRDCKLMTKIRNIQENSYGNQREYNISFSTTKGKAVLVVGSNLRELEQILDKLENCNIDIYTHDNMILAHTFPKFKNYPNLKGQYGQGMEQCLLDFSTFPGPIILTRNSLFNVENLYRGRLFTTDFGYSKGIIQIKNNDFSELIKSANDSKGFKTGKICPSEKIGFSFEDTIKNIDKILNNNKFKNIVIIGIMGHSKEEKEYFKLFLKHIPDDIFVVTFSCCENNQSNILCLNSPNDTTGMLKISEYIREKANSKINIFLPFCDRHTISILLFLNAKGINNIFVGNWNQTILKPNILDGLKKDFGIIEINTPKKDISKIISEK